MKPFALAVAAAVVAFIPPATHAQTALSTTKWVTSWAASVQGPYPVGNASAQPDQRFAFPVPVNGAHDQTFRMMVRPDVWGRQARLRLSNAFGTRALTLDGVYAGLALGGPPLVACSNPPPAFAGNPAHSIAAASSAWTDAV